MTTPLPIRGRDRRRIRRFASTRRGVTLLETVLAVSLLVVLSSMTYWFYSSMLRTREVDVGAAYRLRLIRAVMDQLADEIRQASMATVDGRVGIRGTGDRLWLSSYRLPGRAVSKPRDPREPPPPGEFDVVRVEYSIARHPEILDEQGGWELPLGLARNETRIPRPIQIRPDELTDTEREVLGDEVEAPLDPEEEAFLRSLEREEGGRPDDRIGRDANIQWDELYAPEIRYLRLCYYDGNTWWDTWEVQGENPLPQLVMVTMGFEGHPPLDGVRGRDKANEEFCECLNREPPDCEPLPPAEYMRVVRVAQADPLFRSRVARETQSLIEELSGEEENAEGSEEETP